MNRQLIFVFDNLKYDISNMAYIIAQRASNEITKKQICDICEDNNLDRIKRVLDLAFAEVRNLCYPYAKAASDNEVEYDDISDHYEYVIDLTLPDDTRQVTVSVLRERINEYVVWKAIDSWLELNAPDMRTNYENKMSALTDGIHSAITNRAHATRIKISEM